MDLRPERPQTRIAIDAARQAIDAFVAVAERGPHTDLGLQFRGGEALLNAEVVLDATRYMRARWTRGDVVTSMVSNATLVTESLARALAELGITVEVSIDGPRAVHDLVRITKGGRPTYDRVVAGLARLVAAGVEVTNVNTTVTAETLPLIDASFFAELARLGVRHVNLEPDVLQPVLPDPRELAARVLELRGLANAQGLELLGCWGRAVRALATVREGAALPPPADYALAHRRRARSRRAVGVQRRGRPRARVGSPGRARLRRPIAGTPSHARRERSPSASAARSRACARATPRRRSSTSAPRAAPASSSTAASSFAR